MPENSAIETNGWPSDFSDEAVALEIGVTMRADFGMTGSPIALVLKSLPTGVVWVATTKVQSLLPGSAKYRPQGDGTGPPHYDAIFHRIALIGFRIFRTFHKPIRTPGGASAFGTIIARAEAIHGDENKLNALSLPLPCANVSHLSQEKQSWPVFRACASRQPVFAAKPDMLFRFQPRHIQQPDQHAELVASRQLRQFGCHLRNEGGGLIRAAIALGIIDSRTAIPARGCALSPAPCLGQKLLPVPCLREKMLFLRVQL
jgi:hypothetical protein